MKVLVAFEFSGIVSEAFRSLGHEAWSLDIKKHLFSTFHIQSDFWSFIDKNHEWDLVICHPPCTYLAVSGNASHAGSQRRLDAIKEVERIWQLPFECLAIENPVGVLTQSSILPEPYYIQPWQFGHGEVKKTGIWSRNLPRLKPTKVVEGRRDRIHSLGSGNSEVRSTTFPGIAQAMASQWSY